MLGTTVCDWSRAVPLAMTRPMPPPPLAKPKAETPPGKQWPKAKATPPPRDAELWDGIAPGPPGSCGAWTVDEAAGSAWVKVEMAGIEARKAEVAAQIAGNA